MVFNIYYRKRGTGESEKIQIFCFLKLAHLKFYICTCPVRKLFVVIAKQVLKESQM